MEDGFESEPCDPGNRLPAPCKHEQKVGTGIDIFILVNIPMYLGLGGGDFDRSCPLKSYFLQAIKSDEAGEKLGSNTHDAGTVAQLMRDGPQTTPFSIVLPSAAEEKPGSDMTLQRWRTEHLCTFNSFISANPPGRGQLCARSRVSVRFWIAAKINMGPNGAPCIWLDRQMHVGQ